MHTRLILKELESWKKKPSRKPLILRGARQVGKTTAVDLFGKTYPQYIRINLEQKEAAKIFDQFDDLTIIWPGHESSCFLGDLKS